MHDPRIETAQKLLETGRPYEAEPVVRAALADQPDNFAAMVILATILEIKGELDELERVMRRALQIEPASPRAMAMLARSLRTQGRYEAALEVIRPLEQAPPTPDAAIAICPIYNALGRHQEARALAEPMLADPSLHHLTRAQLGFHLGAALRSLGEHDAAFAAFKKANDAHPKAFSRPNLLKHYRQLRDAFTADRIAQGPRPGIDASKCVFIVGMPRSGTTLVEQIIDAHPRAHGAGELPDLRHIAGDLDKALGNRGPASFADLTPELLEQGARDYLARMDRIAPDAAVVTNKLPHNFELLGLINRMLPGAKVIHCTRNPIDNCLSCYFTALGPAHAYSNNLADLAWAYAQYRKLMADWEDRCDLPILEAIYEELVADVETHACRIIEFVGLPWDDRCLKFHESTRAVSTASVDQVRKPIYTSSVARWKRYEKQLKPLIESLRAAGVELPDA